MATGLFEILTQETRQRLQELAETMEMAPGMQLIRRGEEGGDIYRLLEGRLEVVDTRSRPEQILGVLQPGAVVGEQAFITRERRNADVRALTPVVVLCLRRTQLEDALQHDPSFASDFYRGMSIILSQRLNEVTRLATSGGLNSQAGTEQAKASIEEPVAQLKSALRKVEHSGDSDRLGEDLEHFGKTLREQFQEWTPQERATCATFVQQELEPYLLRSKLGELTWKVMEDPARSRAPLIAHAVRGQSSGKDKFGQLLDEALLQLPSIEAMRSRSLGLTRQGTHWASGASREQEVAIIGVGTGASVAAIHGLLVRDGGRVHCLDDDHEALSFLQSGTSGQHTGDQMELSAIDLAELIQSGEPLRDSSLDLILIEGGSDYLPKPVLVTLCRQLRAKLKSGGQLWMGSLLPSWDHQLLSILLRWPTLRREAKEVLEIFHETGFSQAEVTWTEGIAQTVSGSPGY